jgi:hypothetical protein
MRPFTHRLLLAIAGVIALTGATDARAEALAICHDGGPGSTKQAAKAIETFLRHTEATAGLTPGSLTGEYHTRRASCEAYVRANSPVLVVLDLATHLSKARAWKLEPIAHLGKPDAVTWHVVVRKDTHPDLASLAGKAIVAAAPEDNAFLSRIALGGAGSGVTFAHTRRPLKALRQVGRGKAEAALVDQDAVAHMAELDLPHALVSIHSSEGLPGLTMSAAGRGDTVNKVKAAVSKLCEGQGRKLCKNFGVQHFQAADRARLDVLLGRYGAGN